MTSNIRATPQQTSNGGSSSNSGNDVMVKLRRIKEEREAEGRFWEQEIREMNRWYQM